jgi:hypothetical protein
MCLKNAHSFYKWLNYQQQTKGYVKFRRTRHVIMLNFFQPYKLTVTTQQHISPYLTMVSKKRVQQLQQNPPQPRQPEGGFLIPTYTCTFVVEYINPLFDPKWALQRCTFYQRRQEPICVRGILPYPKLSTARGIWGSQDRTANPHGSKVTTLPIQLPLLCQEMCTEKRYQIKDVDFTIRTTNWYGVARLSVAK